MSTRKSALESMHWAHALTDASLQWLEGSVEEVTFEPGTVLIRQGETNRDCYFLVSGQVEITMNGQEIDSAGPGQPVGESALLYRGPRGATATATGRVRALILKAADFDELASSEPATAEAIAEAIVEHLAARVGRRPPAWTPP